MSYKPRQSDVVFADNMSEPEELGSPDQGDDIPSTPAWIYTLKTKVTRGKLLIGAGVLLVLLAIITISAVAAGGNKSETLLSPDEIEQILRQFSLHGGSEFDDPSSHQYQSLLWSQNNPVSSQERLVQRYALVCIYYATYQVSNRWLQVNKAGADLFEWDNSRGWLTYGDECDWAGVGCNFDRQVIELDLRKNDLSGEFPAEVALLADTLVLLNIESNYFYNRGPEGTDFFGRLSNLQYLYMKDTLVQDQGIPISFGLLTNLKELDCSYSLLHGPLHEDVFTNLHQLKYLEISGNAVEGTIPSTLTALPKLKYFYASLCNLQNMGLEFLIGMPALVEIWLDRNPGLAGLIPTEIGSVTTLESFSATRCGLIGQIPTEFGQLTAIQHVWLYNNTLFGTIPTELGRLSALETLELEGNNMTGEMPTQICALRADAFAESSSSIKIGSVLSKVHADCHDQIQCTCCDCCGTDCADLESQPIP